MSTIIHQWKSKTPFPIKEKVKALNDIPNPKYLIGYVFESTTYTGKFNNRISFLNCRTISWHTDKYISGKYTALWVIQNPNNNFAVQSSKKEDPQPENTLIIFNHHKKHRLLSLDNSFKYVWVGASLTLNHIPSEKEVEDLFIPIEPIKFSSEYCRIF